ncbi:MULTISPECIES: signal peptidase I [Micrococcaceae]|uniref:signal peptidase I n=1 Tax=Micrococcaceae TaxID=1268 RepID=UPI00160CC2B7|nr:signal peptidase I [Citricoccus sp.]MBB5748476.1 signal peptidase I [Micrococcus sp. TA1]HRO31583.1 signal peptidase I [Citricoccus sp.]HRO93657.1 signal peptidase I [Citricoccus sp.]
MAAVVLAAVLASALLRSTVAELYLIPSGSMEPLLREGDRISVDREAYASAPVERGDVVVVDGEGSFAPYDSRPAPVRWGGDALQWLGLAPDTTAYVKRVAGVGGDTVSCCTAAGLLEVDGRPVPEYYLAGPPPASRIEFTAEVPEGRLFLLGDNRHASEDSRSLLGAPGGGMIRESMVLGRVDAVVSPPGRREDIPAGDGR